jgi:hypothetical protein
MKDSNLFVPQGWMDKIYAVSMLEKMVATMTKLHNVKILLQKEKDSLYLFRSGDTYYFWNLVMESGASVVNPKDYDKLLRQMDDDITKVEVKPLPNLL